MRLDMVFERVQAPRCDEITIINDAPVLDGYPSQVTISNEPKNEVIL